jgi:hypothetical protein
MEELERALPRYEFRRELYHLYVFQLDNPFMSRDDAALMRQVIESPLLEGFITVARDIIRNNRHHGQEHVVPIQPLVQALRHIYQQRYGVDPIMEVDEERRVVEEMMILMEEEMEPIVMPPLDRGDGTNDVANGECFCGDDLNERHHKANSRGEHYWLPCAHAFHDDCIMDWCQSQIDQDRHPECPNCRKRITSFSLKRTYHNGKHFAGSKTLRTPTKRKRRTHRRNSKRKMNTK